MKARINKDLTFGADFIEEAIAARRGMSELASELKTAPAYIERRIFTLYEVDGSSKIEALYEIDRENKQTRKKSSTSAKSSSSLTAEQAASLSEFNPVSTMPKYNTVSIEVADEPEASSDSDSAPDFIDFLRENMGRGLEYALKQMEADEAVGEKYSEVDTSASRAALKKLDIEISAAEKEVSEAQSKLTAAQVEKTLLDERVERATEKLRRAKLDASRAASSLDYAQSHLKSSKSKLEELRKQRATMQKDIDSVELPSFSIVPSGDCIVLKAVNYDARSNDSLGAALKWSRRIGEKFYDLTDSEFAVLGRLFGILSKLHGKFKIEFDPSLTRAIAVYEEFKGCFS